MDINWTTENQGTPGDAAADAPPTPEPGSEEATNDAATAENEKQQMADAQKAIQD